MYIGVCTAITVYKGCNMMLTYDSSTYRVTPHVRLELRRRRHEMVDDDLVRLLLSGE